MSIDKLEILRKNLRYLRRKHGYTQDFIADICGKKSYTTTTWYFPTITHHYQTPHEY